jgi:AbrB family looped-hinge helix DNA binding protein
MNEAKLSSKNQIVVPKPARKALGLKAGDKLLVVVRGDSVILLRKPKKYSQATSGVAGGIYPPEYLEQERSGWS